MARTARKLDHWSPAAAAVASAPVPLGPTPLNPTGAIPDLAGEGPVADLHRMIEARLRGAGLLDEDSGRPTAMETLVRRASRLAGWAALLGASAALAVLLF